MTNFKHDVTFCLSEVIMDLSMCFNYHFSITISYIAIVLYVMFTLAWFHRF